MTVKLIEQIDAILPQTQCTLCGYSGCRPYSEAIVYKNETIDRCLPGGLETLGRLASLTNQDASPLIEGMKKKQKFPMLAQIEESACIGCKKCIHVCPVDAILGAAKQMHTILVEECTGCELCVPVCPVDCISMQVTEVVPSEKSRKAALAKKRYEFQKIRIERNKLESAQKHRKMKFEQIKDQKKKTDARRLEIQDCVKRMREKKNG